MLPFQSHSRGVLPAVQTAASCSTRNGVPPCCKGTEGEGHAGTIHWQKNKISCQANPLVIQKCFQVGRYNGQSTHTRGHSASPYSHPGYPRIPTLSFQKLFPPQTRALPASHHQTCEASSSFSSLCPSIIKAMFANQGGFVWFCGIKIFCYDQQNLILRLRLTTHESIPNVRTTCHLTYSAQLFSLGWYHLTCVIEGWEWDGMGRRRRGPLWHTFLPPAPGWPTVSADLLGSSYSTEQSKTCYISHFPSVRAEHWANCCC